MFGKPEWFRDHRFGWGLSPATWQGWVYTTVWGMAMTGPFILLMGRGNEHGAGVWMAVAIAALIFDVWQIKRARNAPPPVAVVKKDPVLYIGDEDIHAVSTKNLDLQLRR